MLDHPPRGLAAVTSRFGSDGARRLTNREWAAVTVGLIVFVVAVELLARQLHVLGPLTGLFRDMRRVPHGSGVKVAALLLLVVCLPARLRWWALGAAVTTEALFAVVYQIPLAQLSAGASAPWILVGTAGYAGWRLRGPERAATLKAAGLGTLLIVTNQVGSTLLGLTLRVCPEVLDPYVALADRALGSPSWAVGQVVHSLPPLRSLVSFVYVQLPTGAAVVAISQLWNCARDGFPRHHIVRTFLLIGLIGPLVYFLFPVVGPMYAYGHWGMGYVGLQDVWPHALPTITAPRPVYFDQGIARNCMPSLHTAWATAVFLHAWRGGRWQRGFGTFWLLATVTATLGLGFHYGIDVVGGMILTLVLEIALLRPEAGLFPGWRVGAVGIGVALFGTVLLATRFAAPQLAAAGPLAGAALLGAVAVMGVLYVRAERGTPITLVSTGEQDRRDRIHMA